MVPSVDMVERAKAARRAYHEALHAPIREEAGEGWDAMDSAHKAAWLAATEAALAPPAQRALPLPESG